MKFQSNLKTFDLCIVLIASLILTTCKKEHEPNPATDYIIYTKGEGLIGAGGGKIILTENKSLKYEVSIDIPAGALNEAEEISIAVTPDALADSPFSLGPLIELKPEGLTFKDSVRLTIKLNSPLNQDDNPIIFQYLPKRGYLKFNETFININDNTIYTEIKHFSLWVSALHPDLRNYDRQRWPVIIDNYPAKPVQNYSNIFSLTQEDVMRAFSQWDYFTDKSFYLSTDPNEDNIALQFISRIDANEFYGSDPFGDDASAVALWDLVNDDHRVILFNDDFTWAPTEFIANNAKSKVEFLETIPPLEEGIEFTALHEIGHLFGLRHQQTEENKNAVMTPGCPSFFPRALTCTDLVAFDSQFLNSCADRLIYNTSEGLNIIAESGSNIKDPIKIRVIDAKGKGVPGITVMFYNDSDISMEFTKYSSTNQTGDASLSEMHVPQTEGEMNIIVYAYLSEGIKSLTYSVDIIKINDPGSFTDIDGNIYNTVKIGRQVWMKENLKTTRYRNGDLIGTTTPWSLDISGENTPKYQWALYGDESNVATYGRYYTWYTVTDSRNICPTGWHVPSDGDWLALAKYLGGEKIAGGKLKETGTIHWLSPNTEATNETGFTALPSSDRFGPIGYYGGWWSSTEVSSSTAWTEHVSYNFSNLGGVPTAKNFSQSVRCLMDN